MSQRVKRFLCSLVGFIAGLAVGFIAKGEGLGPWLSPIIGILVWDLVARGLKSDLLQEDEYGRQTGN